MMEKLSQKLISYLQKDKLLPKKLSLTMIGVIIMGIAVSASVYSGLGTDPCTCINLGISHKIGMPFWLWQSIANLIIFIFPILFNRKLIGFGTVANMFFVGIIADALRSSVYHMFLPQQPASFGIRIGFMLAGVLLLCIGASFYMVAGLGVAPYDSIPLILTEHLHFRFHWIRMAYDITAVIVGWLLGSTVGIATVLIAFGLGPIIHCLGGKIKGRFLTPVPVPVGKNV